MTQHLAPVGANRIGIFQTPGAIGASPSLPPPPENWGIHDIILNGTQYRYDHSTNRWVMATTPQMGSALSASLFPPGMGTPWVVKGVEGSILYKIFAYNGKVFLQHFGSDGIPSHATILTRAETRDLINGLMEKAVEE